MSGTWCACHPFNSIGQLELQHFTLWNITQALLGYLTTEPRSISTLLPISIDMGFAYGQKGTYTTWFSGQASQQAPRALISDRVAAITGPSVVWAPCDSKLALRTRRFDSKNLLNCINYDQIISAMLPGCVTVVNQRHTKEQAPTCKISIQYGKQTSSLKT